MTSKDFQGIPYIITEQDEKDEPKELAVEMDLGLGVSLSRIEKIQATDGMNSPKKTGCLGFW